MSSGIETQMRSMLNEMAIHVDAIMANSVMQNRFAGDLNFDNLTERLSVGGQSGDLAQTYAMQRIRQMRGVYQSMFTMDPTKIKTVATEAVLWMLVIAHAPNPQDDRNLLHHWLPLCYTKNFATRVFTSARGALIQEMRFAPEGCVISTTTVRDKFFAHEKIPGGYYSTGMEQFFGRIEGEYGEVRKPSRTRNAWLDVILYAFFAVQSARNPDPAAKRRFGAAHKARMVEAIFAALDTFQTPHVEYATGCINLRFSPFFPPRVRRTADSVTAMAFPLNTTTAFIISDAPIDGGEAQRIAQANNRSMARHAGRTGTMLYGVA